MNSRRRSLTREGDQPADAEKGIVNTGRFPMVDMRNDREVADFQDILVESAGRRLGSGSRLRSRERAGQRFTRRDVDDPIETIVPCRFGQSQGPCPKEDPHPPLLHSRKTKKQKTEEFLDEGVSEF